MQDQILQKKKEILIDIVKNDYPKYWEDNKEILTNLQTIQEFRNRPRKKPSFLMKLFGRCNSKFLVHPLLPT